MGGKNVELYTKMESSILHLLPFVPSRKRKKGFNLKRRWGITQVNITAYETLNAYDFISLLFIPREYKEKGYDAGRLKDEEVVGIDIDVGVLLKARGVLNKKANRKTFIDSIERLSSVRLFLSYRNGDDVYRVNTSFIIQFEVDENINKLRLFMKKSFIELIKRNGVAVNLGRILKYEGIGRYGWYAVLLDAYIQGTKNKKGRKNLRLRYRNKYKRNEIEYALKLDTSSTPQYKKNQIVKQAFDAINRIGGLPEYAFNNSQDCWVRTDVKYQKVQ